MASDAQSRKRKSITVPHKDVFKIISCPHCSIPYDESERAPLSFICGHTICAACTPSLIRQESARKWSAVCPVDGKATPIAKGDVVSMSKNHSLVAAIDAIRIAGPLPFRIHVRNMAGDSVPLIAVPDDTVGDVKLMPS